MKHSLLHKVMTMRQTLNHFYTTVHLHLLNGMEQVNWKFVKNEQYWDEDTVKLTEINYDVVKETATAVNLYTKVKKIV